MKAATKRFSGKMVVSQSSENPQKTPAREQIL